MQNVERGPKKVERLGPDDISGATDGISAKKKRMTVFSVRQ